MQFNQSAYKVLSDRDINTLFPGGMKFAKQISPLLNLWYLFHALVLRVEKEDQKFYSVFQKFTNLCDFNNVCP